MGQTSVRNPGGVIPPSKICEIEYDLIIIGISEYEKEITDDLVNKYGVDKNKIATYHPQMHGIIPLFPIVDRCLSVIISK